MSQQANDPFTYPAELVIFMPEDLGLNTANTEDLQLYIDSGADKVTAELLLGAREAAEHHDKGELSGRDYDLSISAVFEAVEKRRYALGFPPKKVI